MKNKKRLVLYSLLLILISSLALYLSSLYLTEYAFNRREPSKVTGKKRIMLLADQKWLRHVKKEQWGTVNDGLKLFATYIPAKENTAKTIIVAHGYHENHTSMASYIRMFHNLGYNVLAPDDRGAGKSQGKVVTFGWLDRLDYLKWIKEIIQKKGTSSKIGLFGVSMGGATVMMLGGENLPPQVKAIAEDCGYSSVEDELSEQLSQQYHLPKQPFIYLSSIIAKQKLGFDFRKAKSTTQLSKNNLPVFFIHGDKDTYVPTKMVLENYIAQKGSKKIWVSVDTKHAMTYYNYPQKYQEELGKYFLNYLK